MRIVVQKFGGTSLNSSETREMVSQKIINAQKAGFKPVVVVSAMGRKGEPYATDTLIDFVQSLSRDISPREMDIIMSIGEIISSVVISNLLKNKGYDALALSGRQAGILTNNSYGNSDILDVKPDSIINEINKGKIPVVAGFQGVTAEGDITTLGRGGSDITAAILAEALHAKSIEIYTDVDGIMTADPRIVPNAHVLNYISYSEILQIADQGAKVIHPKAIEVAMRSQIPIFIKNTNNNTPGTVITAYNGKKYKQPMSNVNKMITGITHIPNRTQIIIKTQDLDEQNHILNRLADNNVSIDLINIFPYKMVFTIDGKDTYTTAKLLDEKKTEYKIIENCSKISTVGDQMRGVPGVMSRIISSLTKQNIEVLQTSDSHTTISCLVRGDDTVSAILALHEEFKLYE